MSEEVSKFSDTVAKLRARLLDAQKLDIGKDNPQEFALGMIIQLMNEAEKQRQICVREMHSHRELAKAAEYQASAYSAIHSMAWAVYDGFIRAEERAIAERKARDQERAKEGLPVAETGDAGATDKTPGKRKK
jgi:hypothetical protein